MQVGKTKKAINLIINRKVTGWLSSIEDEALRAECRKNVIVTGGCIASLLLGEEINDVDLYFREYETTVKIGNYYVEKFKNLKKTQGGVGVDIFTEELKDSLDRKRFRIKVQSAGVSSVKQETDYRYFESEPDENGEDYVKEAASVLEDDVKPKYSPVFLSSNAITLSDKIQIIIRFHGDPSAIHENFDFIHCTNYWTFDDGLIVNEKALLSLMSKTLVYFGSLYPVCSLFRTKKFIQRGWKINAGQYVKMAFQISKLDLTNYTILEEQLTGVDTAYFANLIGRLKDKDQESIDGSYFITLINEMFS
jgi:hypothetical protein